MPGFQSQARSRARPTWCDMNSMDRNGCWLVVAAILTVELYAESGFVAEMLHVCTAVLIAGGLVITSSRSRRRSALCRRRNDG